MCTLKFQNSSGKWSLLLRKVKFSEYFLPKNSLKIRLKYRHHSGVLVVNWIKVAAQEIAEGYFGLFIWLKLRWHSCLFRWLKTNLNRACSFTPLISWKAKTEFPIGQTKFRILRLNLFIEYISLSSFLRFLQALAQCGNKDGSKGLVITGKIFIVFWVKDRVKFVLKGATRSHFTHFSCVVIVLFDMALCRSAFSTVSFRKLVFRLSALPLNWIKTFRSSHCKCSVKKECS